MLHIYCGDGKGKTTCAMGLALRCAGRGGRVTVVQFLKTEDCGERRALERMDCVTVLPAPERMKFVFAMTEEEKRQTACEMTALFMRGVEMALRKECDLLVLDELCGAVTEGMIPSGAVTAFLNETEIEVVITGRNPAQEWMDRADYITEMRKIRHPYDEGKPARKGVEW